MGVWVRVLLYDRDFNVKVKVHPRASKAARQPFIWHFKGKERTLQYGKQPAARIWCESCNFAQSSRDLARWGVAVDRSLDRESTSLTTTPVAALQ
jgi:hypothetical protein